MKRINLLCTDSRDVHYPTDEPNLVHVENSDHGKACPDFIKLARRFGTKIGPPRTRHGMSESSGPTLLGWT